MSVYVLVLKGEWGMKIGTVIRLYGICGDYIEIKKGIVTGIHSPTLP